jgi:hypothetical protein
VTQRDLLPATNLLVGSLLTSNHASNLSVRNVLRLEILVVILDQRNHRIILDEWIVIIHTILDGVDVLVLCQFRESERARERAGLKAILHTSRFMFLRMVPKPPMLGRCERRSENIRSYVGALMHGISKPPLTHWIVLNTAMLTSFIVQALQATH